MITSSAVKMPNTAIGGIGLMPFAMKAAAVVSVVVSIACADRAQVHAILVCKSSAGK